MRIWDATDLFAEKGSGAENSKDKKQNFEPERNDSSKTSNSQDQEMIDETYPPIANGSRVEVREKGNY